MADVSSPLHVEVTCSICFDYYKNPVTVDCGHSFCSNCIVSRQVEDCKFPCPQCGRSSHVPVFNVSTQLAKVTEIAKQIQLQANKIPRCDLHGQRLTLYCKEDQTIMCVFCEEDEDHAAHTVIPAGQAAQEYKAELHEVEYLLKKDMENIVKWEIHHNNRFNKWQDRLKETQELVNHCFRKAQQLLHEEKKLLLRRLDREYEVMAIILKQNMENVSRQKSSVKKLISDIEAKTKEPAHDILRDANILFNRRTNLGIQEPAAVPFAFRLNICLPGILEMFQKYAVPVALDPETSNFNLTISENGKSVKYEGSNKKFRQQFRNPERFGPDSNVAVLGRERFVSGRHYWEIEYDVNYDWEVGVCLDSVSREDFLSTYPDRGFWTICTGVVFFPVEPPPRPRIGIFLDYEAGELMFYSVTKNTAIKIFSETFTGILRPYFEAHVDNYGGELTLCTVPQQCEDPADGYILA